jgi:hypothetical protein
MVNQVKPDEQKDQIGGEGVKPSPHAGVRTAVAEAQPMTDRNRELITKVQTAAFKKRKNKKKVVPNSDAIRLAGAAAPAKPPVAQPVQGKRTRGTGNPPAQNPQNPVATGLRKLGNRGDVLEDLANQAKGRPR